MKLLARLLGLVLVAGGFVGLVVDGTRSLVNNALSLATIREVVEALSSQAIPRLQAVVTQNLGLWLWDPVLVDLLRVPASIAAFVLGICLLWFGQQKPPEPIGYLASR
ncbi:PetM family of cytochrome b6f complex subunit 7 [Microvirga flavescens]|uniref:PetM family of cytochrome b6f complex subunit 7 n=1 Tax=Microvirga flavescens TaxID=2249811 RepID=UPI0013003E5C|nr:PetM family of cytochrome b6f complex subunit 7 [Microvirga flavescens]